jgi:hypothetical protein
MIKQIGQIWQSLFHFKERTSKKVENLDLASETGLPDGLSSDQKYKFG